MSSPPNLQQKLMQDARLTASFRPLDLTYIIYDGEEAFRRRENVMSRVEAKLGESSPDQVPAIYKGLGRKALYHDGLRFGSTLLQDEIEYRHGLFDSTTHRYTFINASPFGLHPVMFIPTLKLQASPEQLQYWLPLAESGKIIGAYCQTELGHGTFLRGLETTATFDRQTDEFVVHSPTVSSTKYWPGGIGYSCSHAMVMARLIVGQRDYGVHAFIVQLRSLNDFRPMPGIELGDIGNTLGMNSTDNGYAVFDQVRIPRHYMMMGNAHVSRDGIYTSPSNDNNKHSYITMTYTRAVISHLVPFQLAQAATIAIRYSTVRGQGNLLFDSSDSSEVPIISFKSQHYRLLILMSRAFALLFGGKACLSVYEDLVSRRDKGDHSTLAYTHITTASLKAYATQTTADGADDARKSCGGHGYSALSGMPTLVTDTASMPILEGENYVMYQQAARYLMKCISAIQTGGHLDEQMSYLRGSPIGDRCNTRGDDFLNPEHQLAIFRHRATRLTFECHKLLEDSVSRDGLSQDAAWNLHMMSLIFAARAHIEFFVLQSFVNQVSRLAHGPVRVVLKHLCDLFALSTIESPLSIGAIGFFDNSYISSRQLKEIRAHVNNLLTKLLPEAVGLTDAWGFSDASLQSAIGRKDGNAYETLISWARQLPFNQACKKTGGIDVEGYEKYIRPILHSKL